MVSRAQLRLDRLEQAGKIDKAGSERLRALKSRAGVGTGQSLGMIRLSAGASAADLEAEGVTVLRQRGDILLVSVATDDVERIAALKNVSRMQLARPYKAKLDNARRHSGVDAVHNGTELTEQPYTGQGVITGIVDAGMDPNHINFLDAEGNSRVSYLGHLRLNSSGSTLLETRYGKYCDLPVSSFNTDDAAQMHGTHTMGIMAGGYRGNATVAVGDPTTGLATISQMPNPYYGVATNSDIAASCGDMMDMMIAMGVDDICAYAYQRALDGKPARTVINLSLGSNVGPHDGTDMIHQFFDAIVEQDNPIICVSAGNEGDLPIALHGTFGSDCQEIKSFIRPYVYTDLRYGNMVIYSEDETDFTVQAIVYNQRRGRVSFSVPVAHSLDGSATYYISSEDMRTSSADVISNSLATAFDGYVGVGSMYDEYSGRYYAMIDYYCIDSDTNADGNYLLGFMVTPNEGSEGKRIDIYGDGAYCAFDSYGVAGWSDGMYDGTISDMACGKNILAVGSYNTRDDWGALDGYAYGYDGMFPAGKITDFSSYGLLGDGRALPHVCAPGATIISSANSYFAASQANGITDSYIMAKVEGEGGKVYPWMQMSGTSMASPYVAGSIALWLEADDTLDIDDVKDIVAQTAIVDDDVTGSGTPLQWGAGKFDALGGLKEVLRRKGAGLGNIVSDSKDAMIVSRDGSSYTFFIGGAADINARIYDTNGRCVATANGRGDQLTVDCSSLAHGIYVVRINDTNTTKIKI